MRGDQDLASLFGNLHQRLHQHPLVIWMLGSFRLFDGVNDRAPAFAGGLPLGLRSEEAEQHQPPNARPPLVHRDALVAAESVFEQVLPLGFVLERRGEFRGQL